MAFPRIIYVSRGTGKLIMRLLHFWSQCEDADLRIRSSGHFLRTRT